MAASASTRLPSTHKALVLKSTRDPYDLSVVEQATPQASTGSAVIRVLAAGVLTYADRVYSGNKRYVYPEPFIPGSSAIGRIAAVGNDATLLEPGQLVFFDCYIHGRDASTARILHGLSGGFTPESNKFMENEWRDGTYAEYAKVPLENCVSLDEKRLLGKPSNGGLGYMPADLMYLLSVSVPFGGLCSVNVRSGDKVVIAPAAGHFGSAAVKGALALGAQVIAMGRDQGTLDKLVALDNGNGRVRTVLNTGDEEADLKELTKFGPLDVFFDISPGKAAKSSHFRSCTRALAKGGRINLMSVFDSLPLPLVHVMLYDITIKGKWMYDKEDMRLMVRLLEDGYLRIGKQNGVETVGTHGLDHFAEAFEKAAGMSGPFLQTVITP